MITLSSQLRQFSQQIDFVKQTGTAHLSVGDARTDGRSFTNSFGKKIVYFGNCSYLGLEHDERLIAAAHDATNRHGIQFSCSRTYASLRLHDRAEEQLEEIFGFPTLISPTTALGHLANLPLLIEAGDAVVADMQVHASVINGVKIAQANGAHAEYRLRHNDLEHLEQRIVELSKTHQRIWYVADGVYSMFGDGAPMAGIHDLLNRYEQFHCYIDDAHGMSWVGEHGRGYVLSEYPLHEKMIMITSLAKGFGACAAATIFPTRELRNLVRNLGYTHIFSGPTTPAILAAVSAAAKIHLSDEIYDRQTRLKTLNQHFVNTCHRLNLPLVSDGLSPIFFIGLSNAEVGLEILRLLMDSGYLANYASFPAVPAKRSGFRMTTTLYHSEEDIETMLSNLAFLIGEMEATGRISRKDINRYFGFKEKTAALP